MTPGPKPEERCVYPECGREDEWEGHDYFDDEPVSSLNHPFRPSSSVAESKADRKSPSASRETEVPGTGTTADNQATENRECEANSEALKTFDFPPGTWCNQHIQPISACVQIARLRDDVERLTTEAEEAYDAGFAVGYGFGYSAARRALGEKP